MMHTFQLNVDLDNTINKLTGFFVPIIAQRLSTGFIMISAGSMMIHEIIEIIDWTKIHDDAERIASEYFNSLTENLLKS